MAVLVTRSSLLPWFTRVLFAAPPLNFHSWSAPSLRIDVLVVALAHGSTSLCAVFLTVCRLVPPPSVGGVEVLHASTRVSGVRIVQPELLSR